MAGSLIPQTNSLQVTDVIPIEQGDLHHQLCSSLIIIGMQREGKNGERGTYDA